MIYFPDTDLQISPKLQNILTKHSTEHRVGHRCPTDTERTFSDRAYITA